MQTNPLTDALSLVHAMPRVPTEYVTCEDAASVLDMPVEQCQLLLDMIPAVSSKASSPAGGVNLYDLSLLLMAQLYKREAQKPETQDHWPEPASCSAGQSDAVKGGTKAAQPGQLSVPLHCLQSSCLTSRAWHPGTTHSLIPSRTHLSGNR